MFPRFPVCMPQTKRQCIKRHWFMGLGVGVLVLGLLFFVFAFSVMAFCHWRFVPRCVSTHGIWNPPFNLYCYIYRDKLIKHFPHWKYGAPFNRISFSLLSEQRLVLLWACSYSNQVVALHVVTLMVWPDKPKELPEACVFSLTLVWIKLLCNFSKPFIYLNFIWLDGLTGWIISWLFHS